MNPNSADFNEPGSDDTTSAPAMPSYSKKKSNPLQKSKKPKVDTSPLNKAIKRAQGAKQSSHKYGG